MIRYQKISMACNTHRMIHCYLIFWEKKCLVCIVVVIAFQQYDCIFFEWNCYLRTYGTCYKLALILDKEEAQMYEGDIFEGEITSKCSFKLLFWISFFHVLNSNIVLAAIMGFHEDTHTTSIKFPRSIFYGTA